MADVHIRRCRLRVVRRGGWSWGPDPAALRDASIAALPELLGRELADLIADDADEHVIAPIQIRVPLRLADLRGSVGGTGAGPAFGVRTRGELRSRLAASLRMAGVPLRGAGDGSGVAPIPEPPGRPTVEPAALSDPFGWLVERLARGDLARLLRGWPESVAEGWLRTWRRAASEAEPARRGVEARRPSEEARARILSELRGTEEVATLGPGGLRLFVAALLVARARVSPDDFDLFDWIEEIAMEARPTPGAPATAVAEPAEGGEEPAPAFLEARLRGRPRAATKASARAASTQEMQFAVSSALPFLVLGSLSRMGVLDGLLAGLSAAERAREGQALLVALATKALPLPGRGGMRPVGERRVLQAICGGAEPPSGRELAMLARRPEQWAAPGLSVLRAELLRGRGAQDVLLAVPDGRGERVWFAEARGLFPVGCVAQGDSSDLIVITGASPVVVAVDAAKPALLAALAAQGIPFATRALPARGEHWAALPGRGARWYSDDPGFPARALRRPPRPWEDLEELLGRLATGLDQRRGLPGAPQLEVEAALGVLVGAGLADLAWTLWQEREAADPLLTWERLEDLDAHVRIDEEQIRVRVPLGQRHADLQRAGCLADVPFLDGRFLRFGGG